MSLLKKCISNENYDFGLENYSSELTAQEEVELAEAQGGAESVRKDIEAGAGDIEHATMAASELELQNEAMTAIADENGGTLSPETAAGFELARRAVVASVGIDPDTEQGEELVDSQSLESLSNGSISVEDVKDKAKNFLTKIKDGIKKIWKWIVDKIKQFLNWLDKITNIIPKKFKKAYDAVSNMTDKEFDDAIAVIAVKSPKYKAQGQALVINGKLMDPKEVSQNIADFVDSGKLGIFDAIKFSYSKLKDEISSKGDKEARKSMLKIYMEHFKSVIGKNVSVNGTTYRIDYSDETGIEIIEDTYESENAQLSKIKRKDLLDALNQGTISEKLFARAQKSLKELENNKEADKLTSDENASKVALLCVQQASKITGLSTKLTQQLAAHRDKLASFGLAVAKIGGKIQDANDNMEGVDKI